MDEKEITEVLNDLYSEKEALCGMLEDIQEELNEIYDMIRLYEELRYETKFFEKGIL